jgi:pSer/pThr/pTyr-binding forkhead associated (FHA) protein
MAPGEAHIAQAGPTLGKLFDVVLEPESHPALGAIRVEEDLFAIGRAEAPFASCDASSIAQLSRRHAKIFIENGEAYAADLGSKNGTTMNGTALREKPVRLRSGDTLCFGGKLSFRVRMEPRVGARAVAGRVASVTLTPERSDLGLQPIEIVQFPFLISKADETFAQYSARYPHQVNYVSRRHAHIFVKGGTPFVEDLGSTNGTFVNGERLGDTAVALTEGASLAFGGRHFAYTVGLPRIDDPCPTATVTGSLNRATQEEGADADKTTFITTAHSFLDIFCVDQSQARDDEINHETVPEPSVRVRRRPRSRFSRFISELRVALGGEQGATRGSRRVLFATVVVVVLAVAGGGALYVKGGAERDLKGRVERGDYRGALTVANSYLARHPGNAEASALGTQALLKAYLPDWLDRLKQRDFDGARSVVEQLQTLSASNADARFLVNEIDWIGRLEAFVMRRGSEQADPSIRIYADEDRMSELLRQWESDPGGHQQRLDRIASIVPEFRDTYASAMSHLRKLQSDDSVYLPAIDRLKASVSKALDQGHPEGLRDTIADYADKYPRLAGLDKLQDDLAKYIELNDAMLARNLGALVVAMQKAQFVTPPFQARLRQLEHDGLPSADVVKRYAAVWDAWKSGQATQAINALQDMLGGTWADGVAAELAHKKAVASQFADLQKSRATAGFDDRVMAFYESLDPVADTWFANAIQPDLDALKPKALARAQEWQTQAQAAWTQYRINGAIGGEQRLETGVSNAFKKQARLLADAQFKAQHAVRLFKQIGSDRAAQAEKLLAEITAEVDLQRRSLVELRAVIDPAVLDAKLALIGTNTNTNAQPGVTGEDRRAP